jgi:hypothetical protein
MPVTIMAVLRLYMSNGGYALLNTQTSEWAKVPLFIANEWRGNHYITTRGPFVFHDGFAETDEAQYLLQMLQYSELSSQAQKKVDGIRQKYADWISYDVEVKDYLKAHIGWL